MKYTLIQSRSEMKRKKEQLTNKPLMIFFIALTVLLCVICKEINKKTSIPYASLVLLIGIVLSSFSESSIIGKCCALVLRMDGEMIIYIFIPLLIFEQGFNSDLFL